MKKKPLGPWESIEKGPGGKKGRGWEEIGRGKSF